MIAYARCCNSRVSAFEVSLLCLCPLFAMRIALVSRPLLRMNGRPGGRSRFRDKQARAVAGHVVVSFIFAASSSALLCGGVWDVAPQRGTSGQKGEKVHLDQPGNESRLSIISHSLPPPLSLSLLSSMCSFLVFIFRATHRKRTHMEDTEQSPTSIRAVFGGRTQSGAERCG